MEKFSLCFLLISLISVQVESFQHGFRNRYIRELSPGDGPSAEWSCCKVEPTEDQKAMANKHGEFIKTCHDELNDKNEKLSKHAIVCITECAAKKAKFFENNQLNDDAFTALVKKFADKTEYLMAIAEETAKKCLEKAKDSSTDRPNPDEKKCSRQPMKALKCVHKEFMKSCPAADQYQSERCAKFRKNIDQEGNEMEEKNE